MPAPDRTSVPEIVSAARGLLDERGLSGVTMQAVAERVGVRAPSLYKRVDGREGLIALVVEQVFGELAECLDGASDLRDVAQRFRAFGSESPAAFHLIVSPGVEMPGVTRALASRSSETAVGLAQAVVGERHALAAARTLVAWASGFIIMELEGGFNLDGEVEEAWEYGLGMLLGALGESVEGSGRGSK